MLTVQNTVGIKLGILQGTAEGPLGIGAMLVVRIQPRGANEINHLPQKPKFPKTGRVCIVSANRLPVSPLLIEPRSCG
jgi:hypothetical protein